MLSWVIPKFNSKEIKYNIMTNTLTKVLVAVKNWLYQMDSSILGFFERFMIEPLHKKLGLKHSTIFYLATIPGWIVAWYRWMTFHETSALMLFSLLVFIMFLNTAANMIVKHRPDSVIAQSINKERVFADTRLSFMWFSMPIIVTLAILAGDTSLIFVVAASMLMLYTAGNLNTDDGLQQVNS